MKHNCSNHQFAGGSSGTSVALIFSVCSAPRLVSFQLAWKRSLLLDAAEVIKRQSPYSWFNPLFHSFSAAAVWLSIHFYSASSFVSLQQVFVRTTCTFQRAACLCSVAVLSNVRHQNRRSLDCGFTSDWLVTAQTHQYMLHIESDNMCYYFYLIIYLFIYFKVTREAPLSVIKPIPRWSFNDLLLRIFSRNHFKNKQIFKHITEN